MLIFLVHTMATVTAGLMWPPLMWPKHCTIVAMLSPKQSEMRTMSTGKGFSVPPQLMVDPRLRRTKISMARNSAVTAFQKAWVQTPLKATMMLSLLHKGPHLLEKRNWYQKPSNQGSWVWAKTPGLESALLWGKAPSKVIWYQERMLPENLLN